MVHLISESPVKIASIACGWTKLEDSGVEPTLADQQTFCSPKARDSMNAHLVCLPATRP